MSRSAPIAFGVLPSKDRVLSKPSFKFSKLVFKTSVELKPDANVVIVGFLAIYNTFFLLCYVKRLAVVHKGTSPDVKVINLNITV